MKTRPRSTASSTTNIMAVMDLAAEYYMQTVETVFVRHALPKGEMTHRGRLVDLKAIRNGGLLTVEGEKDDISGVGQTRAANELCVNIPESRKHYHLAKGVGHYGVFNGSRFRNEIAPRIREFIAGIDADAKPGAPPKPQRVAASEERLSRRRLDRSNKCAEAADTTSGRRFCK